MVVNMDTTGYKKLTNYRHLMVRRITDPIYINRNPYKTKTIDFVEHKEAIIMTVQLLWDKRLADDLRWASHAIPLENQGQLYIVGFLEQNEHNYAQSAQDKRLNEFIELLTAACV